MPSANNIQAAAYHLISLLIRSDVEFSVFYDGTEETEKRLIEGMTRFGFERDGFTSPIHCMQCAIDQLYEPYRLIQKLGSNNNRLHLTRNRHPNAKKIEDLVFKSVEF